MTGRKFLTFLAFSTILIFSSFAEAEIRLAVLDVTDNPNLSEQSEITANNFTNVLTKSEAITVVERDELELIQNEQKINFSQQKNNNVVASAKKLGEITGCQYMLLSTVVYENSPIVSLRVIDVATSEIIFADTELSDSFDNTSMISASSKLADRVLEVLSGEQAVVTEIKGKNILINRGSSSGVRNGNFYRVYTGTKRNHINLAVIKIKDVRSNYSYAEIVKNGGNVDVLRRIDKIEAASKEEAQSLIKRKKFPKNRPGENKKVDPIEARINKILEPSIPVNVVDYFKIVKQSVDVLMKESQAVYENKDPDPVKAFNLGLSWYKIGENILYNEKIASLDAAFDKFKTINTNKEAGTYADDVYQQYDDALNELIDSCFYAAVSCWEASAEKGNADAQCNLAYMYEKEWGIDQDYAKASELYEKAAKKGHVAALTRLGNMYQYGRGVEKNYPKAVELYKKAAAQGYAEAQNELGNMYRFGWGVKEDYKKSVELYKKAAAQGYAPAECNLGSMYRWGWGVKKDQKKAFELYTKAAEKGYSYAFTELGDMYQYGDFVQQDMKKAVELYRKAKEMGEIFADFNLEYLGID